MPYMTICMHLLANSIDFGLTLKVVPGFCPAVSVPEVNVILSTNHSRVKFGCLPLKSMQT